MAESTVVKIDTHAAQAKDPRYLGQHIVGNRVRLGASLGVLVLRQVLSACCRVHVNSKVLQGGRAKCILPALRAGYAASLLPSQTTDRQSLVM